jgi:hypothetical protein
VLADRHQGEILAERHDRCLDAGDQHGDRGNRQKAVRRVVQAQTGRGNAAQQDERRTPLRPAIGEPAAGRAGYHFHALRQRQHRADLLWAEAACLQPQRPERHQHAAIEKKGGIEQCEADGHQSGSRKGVITLQRESA